MKLSELTVFAKVLILVLVVGILGTGIYFAKDLPMFKDVTKGKVAKDVDVSKDTDSIVSRDGVIRLSLDEWIGWKSVLDANGS